MPNHSQCSITKSFCCVKRKPVVYLYFQWMVIHHLFNKSKVIKSKYSLKTYEAIYKILDTFLIFSY